MEPSPLGSTSGKSKMKPLLDNGLLLMTYPVCDGLVSPEGPLEVLSRREISKLLDHSNTGLHHLFRNCALAVLAAGSLYAFFAKPVYEASLMLHVEEKGQREPKNILGEAGSMIDYKTPATAEVELLRAECELTWITATPPAEKKP